NYPARGIGKTSIERVIIAANTNNTTFWEMLHHPAATGLKGAAAAAIEEFVTRMKSFQVMLEKQNAYDVAFAVGKHTGLVQELYNDKSVEGLARYENVQELLNSIKEFTETPDEEGELREKTLGSYLQQITLLTDADNNKDENSDVVKLMTIHAAKGLEFPCVFSVGLEENLFPSAMSLYDRSDLEEERRLFYVAITRAKERLWVTYANSRYRFGNLVQNEPSRFIDEIPEKYLDRTFTGINSRGAQGSVGGFGKSLNQSFDKVPSLKKLADKLQQAPPTEHKPTADFKADDPMAMEVGMEVEHLKFGFGKITSVEGGANNRIATVQFQGGHGQKKIMLNYAKIRIVK
ncbi:MAG TPA: 3'-5' exonuclease, partial [Flavipsychrobacter sp.]